MRLHLSTLLAVVATIAASHTAAIGQQAASSALVTEITRLEQLEARSVMKGDTTTLFRLWAPAFVVNNPDNRVVTAQQVKQFIRSGKLDYTSFTRVIEKITQVENVAIAMGYEVTAPQKNTANAGRTVTRRYTDIWVRSNGTWLLTARQATNVAVK